MVRWARPVRWLVNIVVFLGCAASAFLLALFGLNYNGSAGVISGENIVEYDPGFLNEAIQKDSPDGRFSASVVDAGSRWSSGAAQRQPVDIFEVDRADANLVRLQQYGDAGTVWREFGDITWVSGSSVRFSHDNGNLPFQSYELEITIHED